MSATNRGAERRADDHYETPAWCVDALMSEIWLPGGLWLEPCAGNGAIIEAMRSKKCDVTWQAVELRQRAHREGWLYNDILKTNSPHRYSVAITNPPYSLALEVAKKCISLADWTVLLLRLNWAAGAARNEFMRDTSPSVYVLPNRPSFTGKGTDATEYAWFVWSPIKGEGKFKVLRSRPKKERKR